MSGHFAEQELDPESSPRLKTKSQKVELNDEDEPLLKNCPPQGYPPAASSSPKRSLVLPQEANTSFNLSSGRDNSTGMDTSFSSPASSLPMGQLSLDSNQKKKTNDLEHFVLSPSPQSSCTSDEAKSIDESSEDNSGHRGTDSHKQDQEFIKIDNFISYGKEIYQHLCDSEKQPRFARKDYLAAQPEITNEMRATLVDWIMIVSIEYKQSPESLFLTINYLDRFLSGYRVRRADFQLVGVVCMSIAGKFEEVSCPSVHEYLYLTDNSYSKDQFLELERFILSYLNYELLAPVIPSFIHRFIKSATTFHKTEKDEMKSKIENLSLYLGELSLLDYKFTVKFSPRIQALSAVCLALHTLNLPYWNPSLKFHSQVDNTQELEQCMHSLYQFYFELSSNQRFDAVVKRKFPDISKTVIPRKLNFHFHD